MTSKPKISVVIPTCNSRDSVKRAVFSVLSQGYEDLEVVVVDDNQVDATSSLALLFKSDPRVRVVRNIFDHGPSQARNFGVHASYGELVAFLDDDDLFLWGRLDSLVGFYEQAGEKYSFISSGRFAEIDDFAGIQLISGQKFGVITLRDVQFGNWIDIGVLMNRDFFLELGGFDESLSSLEDWDLFMRALKVKDAYKLRRLDYAVNQTEGRSRVSGQEAAGYFRIADKYTKDFGDKWALIVKAQGLVLAGAFSLPKALAYSFLSSSIRPMKMYVSLRIPRLSAALRAFCRFKLG